MPKAFEIIARVRDKASGPLRSITRRFTGFAKSVAAFPFKLLRSLFSPRGLLLGGLATFLSFRGIGKLADDLDAVAKTSDKINATTESIQRMALAAELAGSNVETVSKATAVFSRNLEFARRQTGEQRDAFFALGLDPAALGSSGRLDLVDVFSQVAEGLDRVDRATQKNELLQVLFGRGGKELGALFKDGASGVRELAAEFDKVGRVFSREELGRIEDFQDSITKIGASIKNLLQDVLIRVAPQATAFIDTLRFFFVESREDIFRTLDGIAARFALAFSGIRNFASAANDIFNVLFGDGVRSSGEIQKQIETVESLQEAMLGLVGSPNVRIDLGAIAQHADTLGGLRNELKIALQIESGDATEVVDDFFKFYRERLKELETTAKQVQSDVLEDLEPDAKSVDAWDEFFAGVRVGIQEVIDKSQRFREIGEQVFRQVAAAVQGGLADSLIEVSDALADVISGVNSASDAWQALGDAVEDVARQILRSIQRILAEQVALQITGAVLGSFVNSGGGNGTGNTTVSSDNGVTSTAVLNSIAGGDGGGGSGIVVNNHLHFIDTRDAEAFLLEHSGTIAQIAVNQLQADRPFRRQFQPDGGANA